MKRLSRTFFCALSLICIVACNTHSGVRNNTTSLSLTTRGGKTALTFPKEGGETFLIVKSTSPWKIEISGASFLVVSPSTGNAGETAVRLTCPRNEESERSASVNALDESGTHYTSVKVLQQGKPGSSNNESLLGDEHILGNISLMELPRLSGSGEDYFITHNVENGSIVNYSVEYNTKAHHSRWVCFSFDQETAKKRTGRSNAWAWDPMVPTEFEVTRSDFDSRRFARGHLVASYDRLFTEEANKQTFYYTNMSPQRHQFNEGIWLQMEQCVQRWGRSLKDGEKLYVAKGGTIRKDLTEAVKSRGKLVVPKYYFMAVARENGSSWHTMAFLVEHKSTAPKGTALKNYAISIDELEAFTGLDFFFNLPDEIENSVEAESPLKNMSLWPGI